jgi:hypothetical protein
LIDTAFASVNVCNGSEVAVREYAQGHMATYVDGNLVVSKTSPLKENVTPAPEPQAVRRTVR